VRILYVATDQVVPGTVGGSTHVMAVAEGLAALGHEVHVLVGRSATAAFPGGAVRWHALAPPLGMRQLRFLRAAEVRDHARRIRPDVIMERYYNFGGEGVRAARALNLPVVLEVNAPVVDHPGSAKQWIDRALIVEPMRRWRDWQCRAASLIVTPSASIVPPIQPPDRILELEWGADTAAFHPGARGPLPFQRPEGAVVAVFAGAFRRWHGAIHLVDAIRRLRARGRHDIMAVLIGDGPELSVVRQAASGLEGVVLTGALSHDRVPACLAAADIGVAPFDVAAHAPLALDFYWSPLKVFEYMASGLPVVAPDIPRLRRIVSQRSEGLLYDSSDPDALAAALEQLADDPAWRATLGASARARVVGNFGWDVHCRKLAAAIQKNVENFACN
jgi:glycosyltransferase involved in cell wall biosynthesis